MDADAAVPAAPYRAFFRRLTGGSDPCPYQERIARLLFDGKNVILRAPTGAGKTWAVLAPFFYALCGFPGTPSAKEVWPDRPRRVICALPLRGLAQGIHREAKEAAASLGLGGGENGSGSATGEMVTIQTGEHPDDPFPPPASA